ncbi:MAG: SAM-dependent methyltransferase [Trebonia sp.]
MSEDWLKAASRPLRAARVDSSAPNVARVWNYLVGGRDNFEADRGAAQQLLAVAPVMGQVAVASRAFLRRTVAYLVAEAGIRQFLDIGTGMPTAGNTHEVAQAVNPSCRIVYVDNDPVVLAHARAQLRSSDEGATSYLDADARDTGAIVTGASATLDLARPVGVIMIDILNFLEDAAEVLARLVAAVPVGSYLAVMQPSRDERLAPAARRWNQLAASPVFLRDRDEVARWFTGLELIDPGIVEVHRWRPAPGDQEFPDGMPLLGALARKC